MPVWLTATLMAAAAAALIVWAESRAARIIDELTAIRKNLDTLRALAEEDVAAEAGDAKIDA